MVDHFHHRPESSLFTNHGANMILSGRETQLNHRINHGSTLLFLGFFLPESLSRKTGSPSLSQLSNQFSVACYATSNQFWTNHHSPPGPFNQPSLTACSSTIIKPIINIGRCSSTIILHSYPMNPVRHSHHHHPSPINQYSTIIKHWHVYWAPATGQAPSCGSTCHPKSLRSMASWRDLRGRAFVAGCFAKFGDGMLVLIVK